MAKSSILVLCFLGACSALRMDQEKSLEKFGPWTENDVDQLEDCQDKCNIGFQGVPGGVPQAFEGLSGKECEDKCIEVLGYSLNGDGSRNSLHRSIADLIPLTQAEKAKAAENGNKQKVEHEEGVVFDFKQKVEPVNDGIELAEDAKPKKEQGPTVFETVLNEMKGYPAALAKHIMSGFDEHALEHSTTELDDTYKEMKQSAIDHAKHTALHNRNVHRREAREQRMAEAKRLQDLQRKEEKERKEMHAAWQKKVKEHQRAKKGEEMEAKHLSEDFDEEEPVWQGEGGIGGLDFESLMPDPDSFD